MKYVKLNYYDYLIIHNMFRELDHSELKTNEKLTLAKIEAIIELMRDKYKFEPVHDSDIK
jgi:hypothetical protein